MSPGLFGSVAVPAGVFGDIVEPVVPVVPEPIALPEVADPVDGELIDPVVPAGVPALSLAPVVGLLPIDPDAVPDGVASLPVDGVLDVDDVVAVLPVPDVEDGFDIELSVFGASALLQAPSAATVATIATHLIE